MSYTWKNAVLLALRRYAYEHHTPAIMRQSFLEKETGNIIAAAGRTGQTPQQTISRIFQELRDDGVLSFEERGVYTLNPVNACAADWSDDILKNAVYHGNLLLHDAAVNDSTAQQRVRRGVAALRNHTLGNYRHCCALCDIQEDALLVTSHIDRWADNLHARGLLANTICFCSMHDALFEHGYFAMDDYTHIIWRNTPPNPSLSQWKNLCTGIFKAPLHHPPDPYFMGQHRRRVGLA